MYQNLCQVFYWIAGLFLVICKCSLYMKQCSPYLVKRQVHREASEGSVSETLTCINPRKTLERTLALCSQNLPTEVVLAESLKTVVFVH